MGAGKLLPYGLRGAELGVRCRAAYEDVVTSGDAQDAEKARRIPQEVGATLDEAA